MKNRFFSLLTSLVMMLSLIGIVPTISVGAVDIQTVRSAYRAVINNTMNKFGSDFSLCYAVYDMDANGVPELIVNSGTSEADKTIRIYTYNNGVKLLSNDITGHSGFLSGSHRYGFGIDTKNNLLVTIWGHMGYGSVTWYQLKNNRISTKSSKEFSYDFSDDFNKKMKRYKAIHTISVYYSSWDYTYSCYLNSNSIPYEKKYFLIDGMKLCPRKHNFKTVSVNSTYFKNGYTAKKCATCGAVVNKKYKALLALPAPTTSVTTNSVKLAWKKVSNATGYNVYQRKNNKWVKLTTTTSNTYTVNGLYPGWTYRFVVKPFIKSGTKIVYGRVSKERVTSTLPTAFDFKLASNNGAVKLAWNKVQYVSGYKIYYKISKNGKWVGLKTSDENTTSYTKTGLTKGKKYYFTVRAYRKVAGKTYNGAFATKSVTVK